MLPLQIARPLLRITDSCLPWRAALVLLALLGLAGVPAVAQQRIGGVVRRSGTRERLKDVEVILTGDVLGKPESIETDAEGRYSFTHLSPGKYAVATQM